MTTINLTHPILIQQLGIVWQQGERLPREATTGEGSPPHDFSPGDLYPMGLGCPVVIWERGHANPRGGHSLMGCLSMLAQIKIG
jgi:hypothetical protein